MNNKIEEARRSGIAYALKVIIDAQNNGATADEAIQALKDELKFRNITTAPISLPKSEINKFCQEVKINCVATLKTMTMMTLHDEFGFGHDRLERFGKRFMLKTECIIDDYASWIEYQEILNEECNMGIDLPAEFKKWGNKDEDKD